MKLSLTASSHFCLPYPDSSPVISQSPVFLLLISLMLSSGHASHITFSACDPKIERWLGMSQLIPTMRVTCNNLIKYVALQTQTLNKQLTIKSFILQCNFIVVLTSTLRAFHS